MLADWIGAGVDPERSIVFRQSQVPEHAELALLLGMITPKSWLERVPTYKGQIAELGEQIDTYGFFGYPLLQTADIVLYHATKVPVGQDQLPHLELAREVVRRFNHLYGTGGSGRVPRAAGAADRGADPARHRQPQDVEELRQRDRAGRRRRTRSATWSGG